MKKTLSIALLLIISFLITACVSTPSSNNMGSFQKQIEDAMEEQMKKMPQILEITKFLKSCLEDSENGIDAQACRETALSVSEKKGEVVKGAMHQTVFNEWKRVGNWNKAEKDKILNRLEELIKVEENMIKNPDLLKFR